MILELYNDIKAMHMRMSEQAQKVKDSEDRVHLVEMSKQQVEDKFASDLRTKEGNIYELRSEKKELLFQINTMDQ